jgi:hypothetical protein
MKKIGVALSQTHVKQMCCGCLLLEDKKTGFQLVYDGLWRK